MSDRAVPSFDLGRLALESRALFELGAFAAASPVLRLVGRGDRHPVLVLPGFTASDRSTVPLRTTLRAQGYWVHGWGLGRNMGPDRRVVDGIARRLEELHERHGRTVSLVGWSLGGVYARSLARSHPAAVRQVITLGSPFRSFPGMREERLAQLTVPSTAIYSRTDGIVHWSTCIDAERAQTENIEVRGSHSGLGHNPAVLLAVSDRLSQPEGEWRPFRPPPGMGRLYPTSVWWEPGDRRATVTTRSL